MQPRLLLLRLPAAGAAAALISGSRTEVRLLLPVPLLCCIRSAPRGGRAQGRSTAGHSCPAGGMCARVKSQHSWVCATVKESQLRMCARVKESAQLPHPEGWCTLQERLHAGAPSQQPLAPPATTTPAPPRWAGHNAASGGRHLQPGHAPKQGLCTRSKAVFPHPPHPTPTGEPCIHSSARHPPTTTTTRAQPHHTLR